MAQPRLNQPGSSPSASVAVQVAGEPLGSAVPRHQDAASLAARVKFTAYWALIRVGSSVIRLEIIEALRRTTRG